MIALGFVTMTVGVLVMLYGKYRSFKNWDDWAFSLFCTPFGAGCVFAGLAILLFWVFTE